jgi:hypothetical protein
MDALVALDYRIHSYWQFCGAHDVRRYIKKHQSIYCPQYCLLSAGVAKSYFRHSAYISSGLGKGSREEEIKMTGMRPNALAYLTCTN